VTVTPSGRSMSMVTLAMAVPGSCWIRVRRFLRWTFQLSSL
jgi:hypothetical protein